MIKKLLKNPLSLLGLFIIFGFVFVAVAAPVLAPPTDRACETKIALWVPNFLLRAVGYDIDCDPYQIPRDGFRATPGQPSAEHPLGTTSEQYDILYGMIWGTRTAFSVGFTVVISIALLGIILGSISGYFGRWIDELVMRITEIFLSVPFLIAAIVVTAILGKGLDKIIIALIMFSWPTYARLVRGDILVVREREYVQAARALGLSNFRVIFAHVLPNTIYPIFVLASLDMGNIVITAAALSFLGLGPEPGFADWGQMISFARNFITNLDQYWWTIVYPGAAIFCFVLGWNLLGDAFRDILDPKLRGSGS